MRIRVNRTYSGPLIDGLPAGEYEATDALLYGRAAYLVSIEVAEWIDSDMPDTSAAPDAADEPLPVKRKGKAK